MGSKIDMEYHAMLNNGEKTKPCLCHQQLKRKVAIMVVSFGFLFLLQLCWNIRLNSELDEVRKNINFLLSECNQQSRDLTYYDSDVTNAASNQENNQNENNKVSASQDLNPSMLMEINSLPSNHENHVIVKRSKSKKNPQEKREIREVKQLIRKRKALAIHVQARRPTGSNSSNLNPGVQVPGQTITDWQIADAEHANRSRFGLNSDGCVIVPIDGYYYVYSQVVFTHTNRDSMSAFIGVGTYGASVFTKCLLSNASPAGNNVFYQTCHASGVKYLRRRDCIALSVQPRNVEIYMDPTYTYFGAYFVGLAAD